MEKLNPVNQKMNDRIQVPEAVNYYAQQFSAIVNDADQENEAYGDAIVQGFLLALNQWRQYHLDRIKELDRMRQSVSTGLECTTATSSGSPQQLST